MPKSGAHVRLSRSSLPLVASPRIEHAGSSFSLGRACEGMLRLAPPADALPLDAVT